MYKVTGWAAEGGAETVWLETWEDVLMLFDFIEAGMYRSLLCVNAETGQAVIEMTL